MNVIGYTESGAIRVILDGDESESTVPDDMGNRHRQMIAEWEAEGNTIPPYVAPQPQPSGPYTLQMSDFWSRFADDDEYDEFDAAVSVAPLAKDRRAFGVAMFLVSNSPLFAWTKAILVSTAGQERADTIMANSSISARPSDEEMDAEI